MQLYFKIYKCVWSNIVYESENVSRKEIVPKFLSFEIIALNITSSAIDIDYKSLLFVKLQKYRCEISNFIIICLDIIFRSFCIFYCIFSI